MTERKSTEIKFRVTPSFKARVQSAAGAAGVSLTEWLEDASKEKMGWDYQIPVVISDKQARGTVLIANITTDHPGPAWTPETHPAKSWMYEETGKSPAEDGKSYKTLLTKLPVGRCASCGEPKEWKDPCSDCGVTLNGNLPVGAPPERRKEPCPHSKPPYAFCPTCDK